ncbi:hypothetical protein SAMN04488094_102572 [Tropicimonas isoalkanivorans]|uniref:Uncharacterized protein n=1 Tax=Tropicimonas isoalkanivorans TaxID=441112 RepID=A0A1I1GH84_9RHOB|nr:hypothetical protein SAMN04488094_102572 [Tropicimonas isoalkanivorans]
MPTRQGVHPLREQGAMAAHHQAAFETNQAGSNRPHHHPETTWESHPHRRRSRRLPDGKGLPRVCPHRAQVDHNVPVPRAPPQNLSHSPVALHGGAMADTGSGWAGWRHSIRLTRCGLSTQAAPASLLAGRGLSGAATGQASATLTSAGPTARAGWAGIWSRPQSMSHPGWPGPGVLPDGRKKRPQASCSASGLAPGA